MILRTREKPVRCLRRSVAVACAAASIALLLSVAAPVSGAAGPTPPCNAARSPSYPAIGVPALVRAWRAKDLPEPWIPHRCLGWEPREFGGLIEVAGRFGGVPDGARLLNRIASVSRTTDIRYWSFSRKVWRRLLAEAYALEGPDRALRRVDFTLEEMRTKRDYFLWQKENSLASGSVLRMRFREISKDRILFDQINVSASHLFLMKVLAPGEYEAAYFLERRPKGVWTYYSLTRLGSADRAATERHLASAINRAVAVFRYLGAIWMDREPPAAP